EDCRPHASHPPPSPGRWLVAEWQITRCGRGRAREVAPPSPGRRSGGSNPPERRIESAGAADRIRRALPAGRLRRPARGLDLVRTIAARRLHLVRPVTRRLHLVRPVAGRLHVLTAWRLDLIARRPLGTRD